MIDMILVQLLMDLTIFGHFDGFGAFGDRSDDFVWFYCGSDGSKANDEKYGDYLVNLTMRLIIVSKNDLRGWVFCEHTPLQRL